MNADRRRWLSMIAVGLACVLSGPSFAMREIHVPEEVEFVSDDFLSDEVAQLDLTKPIALQAEQFPWEFELTKQVMQQKAYLSGRLLVKRQSCSQTVYHKLKGLEPNEFEWGFELTRKYVRYSPQFQEPVTFGGIGFNR